LSGWSRMVHSHSDDGLHRSLWLWRTAALTQIQRQYLNGIRCHRRMRYITIPLVKHQYTLWQWYKRAGGFTTAAVHLEVGRKLNNDNTIYDRKCAILTILPMLCLAMLESGVFHFYKTMILFKNELVQKPTNAYLIHCNIETISFNSVAENNVINKILKQNRYIHGVYQGFCHTGLSKVN